MNRPAAQQELRDDPSKIVLAVEEFLRAFGVVTAFRIATQLVDEGIAAQLKAFRIRGEASMLQALAA